MAVAFAMGAEVLSSALFELVLNGFGSSIGVQGDVGEGRLRDLLQALFCMNVFRKHFDVDRDGGRADARDLGVKTQDVAHAHCFFEDKLIDGHSGQASLDNLCGQHPSRQINLCHDPASKDVSIGIAVRGHWNDLQDQGVVFGGVRRRGVFGHGV